MSLPGVGDGSVESQIEWLYKKFKLRRDKGYAHMTPERPTKNPRTVLLETPVPFEVPTPHQSNRRLEAFEVVTTSYTDKYEFLALVELTYDLWWAVANVEEGCRDDGDEEA